MATIDSRVVVTKFSGLSSTAITAVIFLGVGFTLEEVLKRLRRYPDEDELRLKLLSSSASSKSELANYYPDGVPPDRGCEAWAMGYLYRARTYIVGKDMQTEDYSTWPLAWMWTAWWREQGWYEHHCGVDAAVYIRFLRGAFYWTLFLGLTSFPILTSLNWIYSPSDISRGSIDRASLASLAQSTKGSGLLWVHVLFFWILCWTWFFVLFWIGLGVIKMRRNVVRRLLVEDRDEHDATRPHPHHHEEHDGVKEEDKGWRYRTVLMTNIPSAMRSEVAISEYLHRHLRDSIVDEVEEEEEGGGGGGGAYIGATEIEGGRGRKSEEKRLPQLHGGGGMLKPFRSKRIKPRHPDSTTTTPANEKPLIASLNLILKQDELNELFAKYKSALGHLEDAHVELARNVMRWVEERERGRRHEEFRGQLHTRTGTATGQDVVRLEVLSRSKSRIEGTVNKSKSWKDVVLPWRTRGSAAPPPMELESTTARLGDSHLVSLLTPFLPAMPDSHHLMPPTTPSSPTSQSMTAAATATERTIRPEGSLWEVLRSVDSKLLDRFQPLHKLNHFRGQKVPAIDYWLMKLNLLEALIDDKVRSSPESFEPASSAFITFHRMEDSRRARHELRTRPGASVTRGVFECKVTWAPEVRDLEWSNICRVSLKSDLIRGTVLHIMIWAATIFWVIPLSFLVGLLSLTTITNLLPGLAKYLNDNPKTQAVVTNLIPTAIVALFGMLVPTLIGILTRNGQRFITVSKLHASVQARYWKWLMVNIVIVFCIGMTAFASFLNAFRQPTSILSVVAAAFPKAANFFVAWSLLVVGIHHGIEQSLFGIPYINHITIRKLKAPRKKAEEALPRHFSYFYWLPNHLLILAVTSIFTTLNPMVLPFNLLYQSMSITVFKSQFAHVYFRRWYEGEGRAIYRRIFRYSLDSLLVAQSVVMAFFWVSKKFKLGGAIIPLLPVTVFIKIIGTRWFDLLMDELDEVEAELSCGHKDAIDPNSLGLSVPMAHNPEFKSHLTWKQRLSSVKSFATRTLPALTLRPQDALPQLEPLSDPEEPRRAAFEPDRVGSPTSQDNMLEKVRSRASTYAGQTSAGPSSPTTAKFQLPESKEELPEKKPTKDEPPLVTPHPPVVRDDRPRNSQHYDNPAVVEPLARSLWLPRDPLIALDLGDTIDYHGAALVSSEGGRGTIGFFGDESEITISKDGSHQPRLTRKARASSLAAQVKGAAPTDSVDGTERILVAEDVAARVEEEAVKASGRRRGSTVSSAGPTSPAMRRRGSGSTVGSGLVPGPVSSSPAASPEALRPQDSPTIHHRQRPSPPTIPSFELETDQPLSASPDALPASPGSAGSDFFNLSTPSRASPRQQRSSSFSLGLPPLSRIASTASPECRTSSRPGRSPSHATSNRPESIVEGDEDAQEEPAPLPVITQSQALFREILEEERRAHAKRVGTQKKEAQQDRENEEQAASGSTPLAARFFSTDPVEIDGQGVTMSRLAAPTEPSAISRFFSRESSGSRARSPSPAPGRRRALSKSVTHI
ncbi:hypothetical protein T439DRAFT_329510 [Meredithblackwellia eburnea MCA 4105]